MIAFNGIGGAAGVNGTTGARSIGNATRMLSKVGLLRPRKVKDRCGGPRNVIAPEKLEPQRAALA